MYQEDDIHECVSGYRFYYNIGVGKILFDDALNPMDYSGYNMKYGDSIEDTFDNEFYNFYVDKYGICTFYIDCPVSIVRKQENVKFKKKFIKYIIKSCPLYYHHISYCIRCNPSGLKHHQIIFCQLRYCSKIYNHLHTHVYHLPDTPDRLFRYIPLHFSCELSVCGMDESLFSFQKSCIISPPSSSC